MTVAPDPSPPPPARAANIVIYCSAYSASSVGGWMQKAAVGWLSWELTHSAAWVGALALTDVLAALIVGPLAGALIDRKSPFRVVMTTQALLTVHALVLGAMAWTGSLTIWMLLALAMAESGLNGFNTPVQTRIIGLIAGRERISQAIAANSIAFNLARSIGPAIAGVIMLKGHVTGVFGLNALSYAATLGAIGYLRPWTDRRPAAGGGHFFADVAEGFRYVASEPRIARLFMLAIAFSFLARPFGEMLPAFAGEVFKGGPQTLSMLMSAQGVGALIGAGWMLRRRGVHQLVRLTFAAAIALPAVLVVFCANTNLTLAVGVIALAGMTHTACNVGMQSMAQTFADDAFKGRVMALYGLMFRAGPSLGAFLIGLAADRLGLRALIGGAALLAVLLIAWVQMGARKVYASSLDPA